MLRSYDYAAHVAVDQLISRGGLEPDEPEVALHREAAASWASWATIAYLQGYLAVTAGTSLLPSEPDELDDCLRAHLIDKALYELRYELGNRPDWAHIPLLGLKAILADR